MRSRSCPRMDSTAGIGQRRSGRAPRGDEPRYCPSRTARHSSRMYARASPMNGASGQQIARAVGCPAARAAAHRGKTSAPHGTRRFDERRAQGGRRAGVALPRPDPKDWSARTGLEERGRLEVQVREGLRRRRLVRAGGRGRRLVRRSEVSRVDHVTVDNAVLDAPKRSLHVRWSALEKPKLESRRQPRSTW